jgi:hypothetical protein
MLDWIKKVSSRGWGDREKSVFGPVTAAKTKPFTIPKLHGPKAFEVVGIPLPKPGFYVVEIESGILGAALLGAAKPMFVPTAVLATNLSVHFKWGLESSLVWVTALDTGKPVSQAAIVIRDCGGKPLWEGQSDRDGIARVQTLPPRGTSQQCGDYPLEGGLVSAQPAGPSQPAFSPEAAFLVSHILSDRESRSMTFQLESPLATRYWSAVKTGTTGGPAEALSRSRTP